MKVAGHPLVVPAREPEGCKVESIGEKSYGRFVQLAPEPWRDSTSADREDDQLPA